MAEHAIVRRILLPLGLISALPALVNFSIILTKETVILSIITVPELTYQVQRMSTETFRFLEANFVLALFFWGLVEAISRAGRRIEAGVTRHLTERP
jgi:polar amino acid transport system permease protein